MRSRSDTGSRSEMARVESLMLGKRTARALSQSRYCVESRPDAVQKARSSASVRNSGIRLRGSFICSPLFAMHRPGRDDAHEGAAGAQGERHMEQAIVCLLYTSDAADDRLC